MKESIIYSEALLKVINEEADYPVKFNWFIVEF